MLLRPGIMDLSRVKGKGMDLKQREHQRAKGGILLGIGMTKEMIKVRAKDPQAPQAGSPIGSRDTEASDHT